MRRFRCPIPTFFFIMFRIGFGGMSSFWRLRIAIKRSAISKERGGAAFDTLTSKTKVEF